MSLQLVLGNSGAGKTEYLYSTIVKEASQNPDRDYLVIVPEQFTLQTQKKLVELSPNHAIMNIDVLSFKRLAYRVFDELGINNIKVLEETGKNLVLRKIAQEKKEELTVLKANMGRMGYISEVKSLLSELMQYNISPQQLHDHINSGKLSKSLCSKLEDVLVMYKGFIRFMEDKYITQEEILTVLIDAAKDSGIIKDSVLVFDEFTGFTPIQNKLLTTLFPLVEKVYVTLTIDAREDFFHSRGMHELFDMPKKTIEALLRIAELTGTEVLEPIVLQKGNEYRFKDSEELYFLEQNLFRIKSDTYPGDCENISISSLKNPKDELTHVARQINELVQKKGYR